MVESKRQLWEARFKEQSDSGMSIDAWCSQNQISKHTFYYWKQRIRKKQMEGVEKNTATHCIKRSLSNKGCSYDNDVAESAFKVYKTEFANQYGFDTLDYLGLAE